MKKYLTQIIISLLIIATPASAMTLWEYYDGHLPSIDARAEIYKHIGDEEYTGSFSQNVALSAYLEAQGSDNEVVLGATVPQGVATFQTSLLSGITSSASSMTLVLNSVRGGSTLSGYNCFTVDEGSSIAEYICGTVSGTSVSSLLRGVDPLTATTSNATLQFAHRRGAEVKITDFPLIQIMKHQLSGEESFPTNLFYDGAKTPVIGQYNIPTWDYTKAYIDGVAIAGDANADTVTKGLVEIATPTETASSTALGSTLATLSIASSNASSSPKRSCKTGGATVGELCVVVAQNNGKIDPNYISTTSVYNWSANDTFSGQNSFTATSTFATTTQNGAMFGGNIVNTFTGGKASINGLTTPVPVMMATSTGQVSPIDSDVASTTADLFGFVINNCGLATNCYVQTAGIVKGFTGLTAGAEYYVSDTEGVLSTTVGTSENYVGRAVSTSAIQIEKPKALQYLGSQNVSEDTTTVINQPWARFAKIVASSNTGSGAETYRGDIWIGKIGNTSGTIGGGTAGGASDRTASYTATWNTSAHSITTSQDCSGGGCIGDGSGSGTAYYYK